jgi:hypothetical protein
VISNRIPKYTVVVVVVVVVVVIAAVDVIIRHLIWGRAQTYET